ncbi:MAG: amidohydrolase [Alphaproteobacteria bacterium]|nr:MAG: amidohydrolase [Alphaproteobacteria bacterium]
MNDTPRIDAHQHYWHPARGDYFWMPQGDETLDRRYGPDHLTPLLAAHDISGTVLVQAAPSVEETEYLLGIADATPSVLGVVGWVDFEDRGHARQLERLKAHPKFRGVRPMIQDIPDVDWMLREDIAWAFDALSDLDLSFDALGFTRHLKNFLTVLTRHPKLRVVIDHCMKPPIHAHPDGFAEWAEGMRALAEQTAARCKLSGLVTEAGLIWDRDDLEPYAALVLEAFGPERVMWGSDWPVCRLRAEYDEWLAAAEALCAPLDAAGRAAVFGGTAAAFYRLEPAAAAGSDGASAGGRAG